MHPYRLRIQTVLALSMTCVWLILAAAGSSEGPLTNSQIVEMTSAKVPTSVIVVKINSARCAFDTSPDALIALAKAGVDPAVVEAMLACANNLVTKRTGSAPTEIHPDENPGSSASAIGQKVLMRAAKRFYLAPSVTPGLTWTSSAWGFTNHQNAQAYCDNLTYLSFHDWRLPTIEELQALAKISTRHSVPFQMNGGCCIWSNLQDKKDPKAYLFYNFRSRSREWAMEDSWQGFMALCVRSPKKSDAVSGYPGPLSFWAQDATNKWLFTPTGSLVIDQDAISFNAGSSRGWTYKWGALKGICVHSGLSGTYLFLTLGQTEKRLKVYRADARAIQAAVSPFVQERTDC